MKNDLLFVCLFTTVLSSALSAQETKAGKAPLKALLIAGGCCHDYAQQQEAICKGIQARANIQVDVYWTDNSSTAPVLPIYQDENWAAQYDVIIHDECAADVKDQAVVDRILQTHQKIPAVHLHCAMHSFRTGTDAWFKHLGLQSSGHGPQEPIAIQFVDTKHPITETLSNWTTIREELYNNVKMLGAHPLAVGKQTVGTGDKSRVDEAVVVWTNETQGARSFSTTIGHNTETVKDARYLELITRGLLWACNKLTPEYLQPYKGENKVTFIDKNIVKADQSLNLGKPPANAMLVKATASSIQSGNDPYRAVDGSVDTRWCADGPSLPQWLQIAFEQPHVVSEIEIAWENTTGAYQYKVEGSADGNAWSILLDKSGNTSGKQGSERTAKLPAIKMVRISCTGTAGGWSSIREVKIQGEGIGTLWPADTKVDSGAFVPHVIDVYANQGNTVPQIVKLSAQQEAEILKDVTVADGFEATVFASPPAVNYPVFVAADVSGTLYVSSDGNGSLGRSPKRGRVIRLRDVDGDGHADETKVFCEIDAPRGLVWDHDRLYLMHPPHLSAFIDKDGDGVADEQKVLVKNLAFGYDKRPADHTTNGVSLGVDGWLYIAGGDFGFIDAEGTDGRKVTHRGGGVIRVRPDGTGLEVYSTGTRNILEVAISPQMDMFARDNTNDGGGWDVRLHHFTGMDNHGYPRLYKNFPDECVAPLADYGGGSGCGAVYIDEPGFGEWNNAPFTADWGTGSLFRHTVAANGATFKETAKPKSFIKLTRPTDADVDGNSRVYCASWRGATFNWEGPNVGYIVCVRPKGLKPSALPNFSKLTDKELVSQFQDASYRRRMEAQRELVRRGKPAYQQLLESSIASRNPTRNLAERLQSAASDAECLAALGNSDPVIVHIAIRSLATRNAFHACFQALDQARVEAKPILSSVRQAFQPVTSVDPARVEAKPILRALAMMHESPVVDGLIARLAVAKAELKADILDALCRLHFHEGQWTGDSWGTRPDTRGPYYQPEAWSATATIAAALQSALNQATPEEAAALIASMSRNRIQSTDTIDRLLRLAESNAQLIGPAVAQLAANNDIPSRGIPILLKAARSQNAAPSVLSDAIVSLAKVDSSEIPSAMLVALSALETATGADAERTKAREAFVNSSRLDTHVAEFEKFANAADTPSGVWADSALIVIASKTTGSPESRELAKQAIDKAWQNAPHRSRLMQAAAKLNNHYLDEKIWQARDDQDATVSKIAKTVAEQLKIQPRAEDKTPKISTISPEDALAKVIATHGDSGLGQQLFAKANCGACHTVREGEVQKGPFLGTIAKTYKRPDLATAILDPNKTIAQGFVTNSFVTYDGVVLTGFVTNELSDRVTIRDQQGKEATIEKADIEVRKTSPTSVMPTGLMNEYTVYEMASLIDYLESLVK